MRSRSRRSYGKIGDSEQSINGIIYLPNYFITLAKGSCNKTFISLGSVSSAGSLVPWFHDLHFHRLVLPLLAASRIVFLARRFQPESVPYNKLTTWTRDCSISEVAGRIFYLVSEAHPKLLLCSAFSASLSCLCLSRALSLWIKRSLWCMLYVFVDDYAPI